MIETKEPFVKFFEDAPEIPVTLLQLHEEGKVVFFCGAGISYPAGLPGFRDLTKRIQKKLNHKRSVYEKELFSAQKYDELLDILEWKMANGKSTMRQALYEILQPDLSTSASWKTHEALLQLSTLHDEKRSVHLVTTNFDRIFEYVIHKNKMEIPTYCAPFLPIPRPSSWNGLVYLHGLLPKQQEDEEALKRLVVTSGDFGLAYLKDRWASRFVSEMLRQYTICFIGYSLADPVMKYLMDAVAAVKLLGETINPIYMFCPDELDRNADEENNKAIQKIYYDDKNEHIILHKTIKEWASIYQDGQTGKERIIDRYAATDPSSTNNADASTSQVLWALQTGGSHILNRFANHTPLPPFEWLELIERQCCNSYLPKQKMLFLGLIDNNCNIIYSSTLSENMANWLLRYVDDSRLVLWIINSGNQLRPAFKHSLLSHIQKFNDKLNEVSQGKKREENSKSDIPVELIKPLWHLIIEDKIIPFSRNHDCEFDYSMLSQYIEKEMNPILVFKLREFFTPKLAMHKAWPQIHGNPLEWELTLINSASNIVADYLRKRHQKSLHLLLTSFSDALKDGLDTLAYLGESVDERTGFTLRIPSIEEHTQNHTHSCELQVLIDLIRDSWLACSKSNMVQAAMIASSWIISPYVLFQRLALYAASKDEIIAPTVWLQWLYQYNRLWEPNFAREVLRLLATQAKNLSPKELKSLTDTILSGPSDDFFDTDKYSVQDKIWYSNRFIWLRLAKIKESGCSMSTNAQNTFEAMSKEHPEWKLGPNQKEEFSSWCCGTGDPDFEAEIEHIFVPRTLCKLLEWLKTDLTIVDNAHRCFGSRDDWKELCKQEPQLALDALLALCKQDFWNIHRIDEAFETWRNSMLFEYGNQLLQVVIKSASDDSFRKLDRELAFYCESAQKDKQINEVLLLLTADRLFTISYEDCSVEKMNSFDNFDPLNHSLNHAIGMITQTLLDSCFSDRIQQNEGIDDKYQVRFERLCDYSQIKFRHGRFALATKAIALYYANPNWAQKYIVPLFDWSLDEFEASSAWYGFLWHAAVYQPLLHDLQPFAIEMLSHINNMPRIRQNFISLLLGCWYYRVKGFSRRIMKSLIGKFDKECLLCAAKSLSEHLRKSSIASIDKRFSAKICWTKDVIPIIQLWPHDSKLLTDEIRCNLALIVFYSEEVMKDAKKSLQWALAPLDDAERFLFQINKSPILSHYPEESLAFIHLVVHNLKWGIDALQKCLQSIGQAMPCLKQNMAFIELAQIAHLE